jgi:predicted ABC-type ATPase
VVALAGPNGAGKSTFYHAHLASAGLRFLNADDLARELDLPADEAASLANELRHTLVEQRESFVFETVLSDPVGDKVGFLRRAAAGGYAVLLVFVGIESAAQSDERVAMRVLQGGHDVPPDKIAARFDRTIANLARAVHALPHVMVFDGASPSTATASRPSSTASRPAGSAPCRDGGYAAPPGPAAVLSTTISPSRASTFTRPPACSAPNRSSSASAALILVCTRRAIGRAPNSLS